MIRPFRIAEIVRATDEGIGSQRRPDGIGQFCGGFHHDNTAAGPADGEPESTHMNAEARIAGLDLRQPRRGRTTTKRRAPAG